MGSLSGQRAELPSTDYQPEEQVLMFRGNCFVKAEAEV
jgi:hypothetical protein